MAVRLIIEDLEGSTTVVNLGSEDVTIGRKPDNTIQLTEQNVSRSHAKLAFEEEGWSIADLGSYNGVRVNGVPIAGPTLLRERDLIQIGDYHLTLTDKADRATIDIERPPAAANDSMPMAMASSAELPSVSVEDLPRAGTGPTAHRTTGEPKRNNVGLIVGVLGILFAVGGVALWFVGDKGKDTKTEVADAKSGQPTTTTGQPAAEAGPSDPTVADPTAAAVPAAESGDTAGEDAGAAVADDTSGEVAGTEAGTEAGAEAGTEAGTEEVIEDPEPEPAPAPAPKPKPTESKPAAPKLPPDEALAAARKASLTGNNKQAYSLAKDAYDQNKSSEALSVMGVAACKMGSASKAKSAYNKMTSKDKQTLEKVCEPLGITF